MLLCVSDSNEFVSDCVRSGGIHQVCSWVRLSKWASKSGSVPDIHLQCPAALQAFCSYSVPPGSSCPQGGVSPCLCGHQPSAQALVTAVHMGTSHRCILDEDRNSCQRSQSYLMGLKPRSSPDAEEDIVNGSIFIKSRQIYIIMTESPIVMSEGRQQG